MLSVAFVCLCVCICPVRALKSLTYKLHLCLTSFMYIFRISRSNSYIKVIGSYKVKVRPIGVKGQTSVTKYTSFDWKAILFECRSSSSLWSWTKNHLNSKVVPYSITSVGLGADPGFSAVCPQVTVVINQVVIFHQARGYFPSQREHPLLGRWQIILLVDRHTGVSSLPKATAEWCPARNWTRDVQIARCMCEIRRYPKSRRLRGSPPTTWLH